MKRLGCFSFFVIAVLAAALLTCPDKNDHVEKISSVVSNVIDDETMGLGKFAISLIDGLSGINHVQHAVGRMLDVESYYIFSMGSITWEGKERIASVGVFGMVLTIPEEMLKKKVEKVINEDVPKNIFGF